MIKVIKKSNGVLVDSTAITKAMNPRMGISDAYLMFMPSSFIPIFSVSLFDDRVVVVGTNKVEYNVNLTGEGDSYPVSQIGIEGALEQCTTLQEIFNKLVTLL